MSDRQYRSKLLDGVAVVVVGVAVVVGGVILVFGVVDTVGNAVRGVGGVRGVVDAVLGVFVVVVIVLLNLFGSALSRERRGSVKSRRERRSTGGSALEWAGRLLPEAMAEEYIEEWRAWLADLQEAGEPWYRRTAELLVIVLVAAPRLAIICRLPRRRWTNDPAGSHHHRWRNSPVSGARNGLDHSRRRHRAHHRALLGRC